MNSLSPKEEITQNNQKEPWNGNHDKLIFNLSDLISLRGASHDKSQNGNNSNASNSNSNSRRKKEYDSALKII